MREIRGQHVLVGGMMIVALLLGSWIMSFFPNIDDVRKRPFEHPVGLGSSVELRTGTLKIKKIQATSTVRDPVGKKITTAGIFVVVEYLFTPRQDDRGPRTLIAVDDQGRTFEGASGHISCGTFVPGVPSACTQLVEVATDSAHSGLRLEIPAHERPEGDDVAVLEARELPNVAEYQLQPGHLATAEELR